MDNDPEILAILHANPLFAGMGSEKMEALPSVTRLSKTVLRILGQNPWEFTLQGTNTYLLGEHNPYILIDTGEGREEYIPFLRDALLDKTNGYSPEEPLISDIIVTHKHGDHMGGLPSVLTLLRQLFDEQQPAPSSPYSPPRIHMIPLPVPDARLTAVLESLSPGTFAPGPGGTTVHDLSDSDTFPVTSSSPDAPTIRIIHTPGHTDDSLCIHYPHDHALFTADTVIGHGTAVFEDLGVYMDTLRQLIEFAQDEDGTVTYTTLYPGHGEVVADGLTKVTKYLQHRIEREEQIIKVLRQPLPKEERLKGAEGWTKEGIVASIYAKYPKELWGPAAKNVELHLRKLESEGSVEKAGDAWMLMN